MTEQNWLIRQYAGQRIHFGGKGGGNVSYVAASMLARCGAIVTDEVTADLDFLVIGSKTKGIAAVQKQAEKLNAKGAHIEIVGEDDFGRRLLPPKAEVQAIVRAGDRALFHSLSIIFRVLKPNFDLTESDFRGLDLTDWQFDHCDVSGSDFSGITVNKSTRLANQVKDARFDGARLSNASLTATGCSFRDVVFEQGAPYLQGRCDFSGARFSGQVYFGRTFGSCFAGADFSGCVLHNADFSQCDLSGAHLTGVQTTQLKLVGANLRGADFSQAGLLGADLSGANVTGAKFFGADLTGVKWEGVDKSLALGLTEQAQAGPHLDALVALVPQFRLSTSIVVDLSDYQLTMKLQENSYHWEGWRPGAHGRKDLDYYHGRAADPREAMQALGKRFPSAKPRPDSLTVETRGCPPEQLPEVKKKALLAWYEVFGVVSDGLDFDILFAGEADYRARLLQELRGRAAGIELWNARSEVELARAGSFSGVDLASQQMMGLKMTNIDLRKAHLEKAMMRNAVLVRCDLREANLRGADLTSAYVFAKFQKAHLEGARLAQTKMAECEFTGAHLSGADLKGADLTKADCSKADFSGADLRQARLGDANFRGANLSGVQLEGAYLKDLRYDEQTVFSGGFTPPLEMQWAGKGRNPYFDTSLEPAELAPLSYEEFLTRLKANTQRDAFAGASQMLKSSRYKLFCDLAEQEVTGVVRSQSDTELIYSCHLASDGSFACCSHNLKPCGGLRGKLCKHILVLLVGLTRAGQLAPERADRWMMNSRRQRPLLDKDKMSEALLRYQSAQARELDWRPTETVPEDFLAL